jgi:hypothetical protein
MAFEKSGIFLRKYRKNPCKYRKNPWTNDIGYGIMMMKTSRGFSTDQIPRR